MAHARSIAKIILVLGFLVLLINEIPGMPRNTAWENLESTLSHGPSLPASPVFGDPYTLSEHTLLLTVVGDSALKPYATTDTDAVPNCSTQFPYTAGAYWGCVNSDDNSVSYASVSPACCANPYEFSVTLSTFSLGLGTNQHTDLIFVNVTYSCKAEGTSPSGAPFNFDFFDGVTVFAHTDQGTGCVYTSGDGNPFRTFTATGDYRNGLEVTPFDITKFSGTQLIAQVANTIVADISYLAVRVTYMVENFDKTINCGTDVACAIGQAWSWFSDFVRFVIGGFIFIFQYAAGIIIYFFSLISNFVIGLITAITFFFAIPGTPPIIQGIIDVFMVGMIGYLVIFLLGLIRGHNG